MIAIVLIGVMIDRAAITFRTLSVAAFGVLILAPQAVVHPSFQMSFAATLALVAVYQYGPAGRAVLAHRSRHAVRRARRFVGRPRDHRAAARLADRGPRHHALRGLSLSPRRALRRARQSAGNAGGLGDGDADGHPRRADDAVRLRRPVLEADGRWPRLDDRGCGVGDATCRARSAICRRFGVGPLLLGTGGLLLMCLLRTPLRWSGAALGLLACLWALGAPRPDVLIAADGAVRCRSRREGRLQVLASGRDTFAVKEWLSADGDPRKPGDASLKQGVRCDAIGCTATLANGRVVALAQIG